MVGVVHSIVVQQQHLACPFSGVLLDFVMKLCKDVKVTVVPNFGKAMYTKAMAYRLTSLASFNAENCRIIGGQVYQGRGISFKKTLCKTN
jgi:hypothetical protein